SASRSHAHSSSLRSSSSATRSPRPSTSPSRRRSSNCSGASSRSATWRCCSSRTTWRSSGASRRRSWSCRPGVSSRSGRSRTCWSGRSTPTRGGSSRTCPAWRWRPPPERSPTAAPERALSDRALAEVRAARRQLDQLDRDPVGIAQVAHLAAAVRPPRNIDGALGAELGTDRTQALEVGVHVLGDQAEVCVPDVVGFEVDPPGAGYDVLEQLEDRAAGKAPERAVQHDAWVPEHVSDVLDVPALPQHRLLVEERGVERDRPVEARDREADVVEAGEGVHGYSKAYLRTTSSS